MDSLELARIFPGLIANYLEDASPPRQVQPGPIHDAHPSWSFLNGSLLTVGAIFHDTGQLRVTTGIAVGVPYAPEVSHAINRINNKILLFGRMFLIGNEESGLGCILMQEIFLADSLSQEHPGSLQNLLSVIAALGGQGGTVAPQLREEFHGRAFTEDEAFFLQTSG